MFQSHLCELHHYKGQSAEPVLASSEAVFPIAVHDHKLSSKDHFTVGVSSTHRHITNGEQPYMFIEMYLEEHNTYVRTYEMTLPYTNTAVYTICTLVHCCTVFAGAMLQLM